MPTSTEDELVNDQPPAETLQIESCHSVWLFDEANLRFRRIVKGIDLPLPVTTGWRAYDHLVLDERAEAFLVFLDSTGTRLLRARRHLGESCPRCSDPTREISLEAIAHFPGREGQGPPGLEPR